MNVSLFEFKQSRATIEFSQYRQTMATVITHRQCAVLNAAASSDIEPTALAVHAIRCTAHNLGTAQMHPCVERRFLAALVQPYIDTAGNRVSGGVVRVAYRNPDREFM